MTQWLRAVASLAESGFISQHPHEGLQSSATLISGAPKALSGSTGTRHIDGNIHAGKIPTHLN